MNVSDAPTAAPAAHAVGLELVPRTATAAPEAGRSRTSARRWRFFVIVVILVAGLSGLAVAKLMAGASAEGVLNGLARVDTNGWVAGSDAGRVEVDRIHVDDGPDSYNTVVELRRRASEQRSWARALVSLSDPVGFLQPGHRYRLTATVRNVIAQPSMVGLLLANGNYAHRPMESSRYVTLTKGGWQRISLDFTCRHPASADTAVYFALPQRGPIDVQVTDVSLHALTPVDVPQARSRPTTSLSFAGAAGRAPSTVSWGYDIGGGGWGNKELQTYTSARRNSSVDGAGHLTITARREDAVGPDGIRRHYTSARLSSQGKVEIAPGSYVEAEIVAPAGQGVWPAFWLLGRNIGQVGWPACGELDIFEALGADPKVVHSALHMAGAHDPKRDKSYGNADGEGGSTTLSGRIDAAPHRYGVYFDQDKVVFYVDRQPTLSYTATEAHTSGRTWPFDKPQFMVLNVAVGGKASPTGTTFPKAMQVSTVKIWRGGVPFKL